ncbi:winged helix-turn-helix transcriptional regulator [Rhodococcus opacus]|uniref:winged helix-turn-helix transcriptional regulator n=1 Tax=Rhodococcus opacus TaxID=37919 RepID=UPI0035C74B38
MDCPIAFSLGRVGDWWSILILRDATHGITRFDQFQKSLGISTSSLSRRLGVSSRQAPCLSRASR